MQHLRSSIERNCAETTSDTAPLRTSVPRESVGAARHCACDALTGGFPTINKPKIQIWSPAAHLQLAYMYQYGRCVGRTRFSTENTTLKFAVAQLRARTILTLSYFKPLGPFLMILDSSINVRHVCRLGLLTSTHSLTEYHADNMTGAQA